MSDVGHGTVTVELIWDSVIDLLRDTSETRLHPDSKIMLASLVFADNEGVAIMRPKQLMGYLSKEPGGRAGKPFVQARITHLIEVGVLAPGSTTTELRSMVGRTVEEDEGAGGTDIGELADNADDEQVAA